MTDKQFGAALVNGKYMSAASACKFIQCNLYYQCKNTGETKVGPSECPNYYTFDEYTNLITWTLSFVEYFSNNNVIIYL